MRMRVVLAWAAVGILAAGVMGILADASAAGAPGGRGTGRRAPGFGDRGWRIGVQTYTFNRFTLFEAIDKAKAAGVRFIEAYPGQKLSPDKKDVTFDHNASDEVLDAVKKKLEEAGIRLVNYGVVGLGKDEAANRKVFDFAKKMGIETIVSEPPQDCFDLLDKLTEEYRINVALHNHPKPSRYWDPDVVLAAVEGHSRRIGACADTGHWMRSGIVPLEAVKKLKGRIISSHFKDLDQMGGGHDVIWGTGKGDAKAVLEELFNQGFRGVFSIEYEYNWENSLPEVTECVKFFNKVTEELRQKARERRGTLKKATPKKA
ncbi:MAG: sugar phosphate isomerase/epimerase [Planctomycetes bacterium]|nr:sugar phosphate isomerase/epimerase [Planctomycetota bacterium]